MTFFVTEEEEEEELGILVVGLCMSLCYSLYGFLLMEGPKLISFVCKALSPGREGALPQHCDSLFGDLLQKRSI